MCEERLSGILCPHQSGLDVIAVTESTTERVGIRIAEVAVAVALPTVERNAGGEEQRVFRTSQNLFQCREGPFLLYGGDTHEIGKKLPADSIQGFYHGQLAQALHTVILVDVGLQLLDLSGCQERYALQVLPGSRVEIDGMCGKVGQGLEVLFPGDRVLFTGGIEFVKQFFPFQGLLCGHSKTGKSKEEGQ